MAKPPLALVCPKKNDAQPKRFAYGGGARGSWKKKVQTKYRGTKTAVNTLTKFCK